MTTDVDHPCASREDIEAFVTRWKASGAAELANGQLFLAELCELLDTPRPDPATPENADNAYVFERAVTFNNGDGTTSPGRIDLYTGDWSYQILLAGVEPFGFEGTFTLDVVPSAA